MKKRLLTVKLATLFLFALVTANTVHAQKRCAVDDSKSIICLKNKPERIISLAPGSTELLYAAGAGSQIIAVDLYSDYPPATKKLPKVGGYPNVNIETLISMKPDLIIAWTGGNSPKLVKQIEASGLRIFRINPENFDDIESAIRKLGKITGNEKQANKNANNFSTKLASLQKSYQQQPVVSVFFEIWRSPLMAAGGHQIIDSAINLCGGNNVFSDALTKTPVISIESLLAKNPDVIISSDPRGNTKENQQAMLNYWAQWPVLNAVKKKQLFTVPSDLIARPTPRLLDGAEQICQLLQSVRIANSSPGTHEPSSS